MADSTTASSLPRNLSTASQLKTMIAVHFRQLLMQRKTRALAFVEMLPVIGTFIYVIFEDIDGLTMFSGIVESLMFPFLIPLAAIFFGGPAIVDEMEGRTLTYLTLRPINKPALFVGKLLSSMLMAWLLVIVPLVLLFVICVVQSGDVSESLKSFQQVMLAATCGVAAYTAVFAALGAAFASSLLASIIYFVTSEMVIASLPVLELLSIRYHLRTAAGFSAADRLGILDRMVLEEPIVFDWWVGALVAFSVAIIATGVGAYIFKDRQYHV